MKFYKYKYQCDDCGKECFSSNKAPDKAGILCSDCFLKFKETVGHWTVSEIANFEYANRIFII